MRGILAEKIRQLIAEDCETFHHAMIWEDPIVGFADARDPYFASLRQLIRPDHHLPQDFLPGANTVISWFLPFRRQIGSSNREGELPSDTWSEAYLVTNAMAARINDRLCAFLKEACGAEAGVPFDAGMLGAEIPWSLWSQRHVAYLAGLGTFGMNNMLISDAGCTGRYFSLVTSLVIPPDSPQRRERCLYKRDGSCGICMKHCPTGALTADGFDRYRCMRHCARNEQRHPGAKVCGKCVVALPCSHCDPTAKFTKE